MSEDDTEGVKKNVAHAFGSDDLNLDWNQVADVALQAMTYGFAGINKEGKLKDGTTKHIVDEGVGEVIGRNKGRKEIQEKDQAIDNAMAAQAEEMRLKKFNAETKDVQESRLAGTAQKLKENAAKAQRDVLGGPEKDFLGL